ncbi:DUF58 domain-containing protein [Saccharibacillus sp. O23]|uniref:DUF58 domain-containing protein n=1 Tax=Saccharibacillus sp. O23 TaxID=2009338 RepID=UPI0015C62D34|nr:DUF58 domain-containing protein [Saccharibacillus sp. O23]
MALLGLLLAGAILIAAQALLIGRGSLRGIVYSRRFDRERCFAGDRLELIEVIENRKKLPVPWLRLESEFPAAFRFRGNTVSKMEQGSVYQTHTSGFALLPGRRVTRRHFVVCENRGIFRLSTVFMTAGDLLGFVIRSRSLNVESPLIVYPALLEDRELPYAWHSWQGEFAVRRWILEDPFMIEGSREYAPGDPMNRIDWKATARTGGLQVYKQGHSADPRVMIVLDIGNVVAGLASGSGEAEAERAISLAATCADRLIASGVPVGFVHNAHTLSAPRVLAGSGAPHRHLLLEAMAGIRLKERQTLAETLNGEARERSAACDYLIVSSADEAEIRRAAEPLERMGHRIGIFRPTDDASAASARPESPREPDLRKEVGA